MLASEFAFLIPSAASGLNAEAANTKSQIRQSALSLAYQKPLKHGGLEVAEEKETGTYLSCILPFTPFLCVSRFSFPC